MTFFFQVIKLAVEVFHSEQLKTSAVACVQDLLRSKDIREAADRLMVEIIEGRPVQDVALATTLTVNTTF